MDLKKNVQRVRDAIGCSAEKAGRDNAEVKLVCVTKYVGTDEVRALYELGEKLMAESRVQEARKKVAELAGLDIEWHMIGHLQTNKVNHALNLFQYVHSVDRLHLAKAMARRATMLAIQLPVLIEVNVAGETSKQGCPLETLPSQGPDDESVLGLFDLVKELNRMPGLGLRGLMTMAPYSDDPEDSRPVFLKLRELRDEINDRGLTASPLTELSMGMTGDFTVAVEEGATFVRVGSGLFEK
jgi:pyridoxal phosphate enzyme (YggS family)